MGDSPAYEIYVPTFRNTLSFLSSWVVGTRPMKIEQIVCSEMSAYKIHKQGNHPPPEKKRMQHSRHGESLKKHFQFCFNLVRRRDYRIHKSLSPDFIVSTFNSTHFLAHCFSDDDDDNNNNNNDRTIPNNKPDIIIRDNEKGTCMLIDVAISGDRNVIKKEAEKILKYATEIQRMWNVKTKVISVIIGATGTISKSFRKYVSIITGNHEVKELQKTATLGTAHILRKVLMQKYNRFNTETNDISTMNSNNRIVATQHSLGT